MESKPGLYRSAMNQLDIGRYQLEYEDNLSQQTLDHRFVMGCNGYFRKKDGRWHYSAPVVSRFVREFKGQNVSFFGPDVTPAFFSGTKLDDNSVDELFSNVLNDYEVKSTVRHHHDKDTDQAARIAYIFGGIARQLRSKTFEYILERIQYVASLTRLGEKKSGLAIASAMSMYILSGGSMREDDRFRENISLMAKAIEVDDTNIQETADLGLSQVNRLWAFDRLRTTGFVPTPFPKNEVTKLMTDLAGFPTVGAEFHRLNPGIKADKDAFLKILALINMSMFHLGNHVQKCRDDKGVVEIRMNPSYYPVTIANWEYMNRIIPGLDSLWFHTTYNRQENNDFSWEDSDKPLINLVNSVGLLCYGGKYTQVPEIAEAHEINYGDHYLGQTQRVINGEFKFSGLWGGNEGSSGQLSIYAGYKNFRELAVLPTFVLTDPSIVDNVKTELTEVRNLDDALKIKEEVGRKIFQEINLRIALNDRLRKARRSGDKIIDLLMSIS